jgi:hypothetical protein
MTKQTFGIDITPEDSVVPIYLIALTEEEISEREAMLEQHEIDRISAEEKEISRLASRESALAKLAKLGLTEEEARAIIGI